MPKEKINEREEVLIRLISFLVTGLILWLWAYLIILLLIVNWIIVIFNGKSNKELVDFCEIWNTESYRFVRYITMESNERPFPFSSLKL